MEMAALAPQAQWRSQCIGFIIGFSRCCWCGVQAPLGFQWLSHLLWAGELEVAGLLRNDSTFMGWLELGHKLGLEAAGLLGVQVANFLWDVNKGSDLFVVALLWALLGNTASSTNLNWELLALGVTNKLARLLLNVLGGTAGLIDSPAFLWTLSIADLFQRLVALLDSFIHSLLLEGDLAGLFKVLLADLLLSWSELCHIGVVALFNILVGALKNGVLLQGCDSFFLFNAAKPGVWVIDTSTEVDASLDSTFFLAASPGKGVRRMAQQIS